MRAMVYDSRASREEPVMRHSVDQQDMRRSGLVFDGAQLGPPLPDDGPLAGVRQSLEDVLCQVLHAATQLLKRRRSYP